MKIKILLMLVISFFLSAFSAVAEMITGTIYPSRELTIASQVEAIAQEKGKAKLMAKTVHPSGIKRIPKTDYVFKAQVTCKGVIISELWPVKNVAEMDDLIAERDEKVIDSAPVVPITQEPVMSQVVSKPETVRKAIVVSRGPVKIMTVEPNASPFPANLAEAKASLPPIEKAGPVVLEETLLGTIPPPTVEEVEVNNKDAEVVPVKKTGSSKVEAEAEEKLTISFNNRASSPPLGVTIQVPGKFAGPGSVANAAVHQLSNFGLMSPLIATQEEVNRWKEKEEYSKKPQHIPDNGKMYATFNNVILVFKCLIGGVVFMLIVNGIQAWLKKRKAKKLAHRMANPITPIDKSMLRTFQPNPSPVLGFRILSPEEREAKIRQVEVIPVIPRVACAVAESENEGDEFEIVTRPRQNTFYATRGRIIGTRRKKIYPTRAEAF